MARRPFFSGDYGSALGSYDQAARLVAQAGQEQGRMFANLGQTLGSTLGAAIEKYGLNKEKRAKEEDAAMASLSTMSPFDLQEMGQNNPKVMKAIENALGDTAKPRDFQLVNATIAPYNAKKARDLSMESQRMQNEMQGLTLGIATELRDTTVQLQKDKAIISGINAAIAKETNPQRLKLLQSQLVEAIANLGEGAAERALRKKQRELAGKRIDADISVLPSETEARITIAEDAPLRVRDEAALRKEKKEARKAYSPADQAKDLKEIRSMEMRNAESLINARDAAAKAGIIKALAGADLPGFAELAADADQLLGRKTIQISGQSEPVSLMEYYALHDDEAALYPLTGPGSGMAGNMHGQFMLLLNKAKASDPQVQADVTAGRGAPGALPPEIAGMTPEQIPQNILDIENEIINLSSELETLGTPGSRMPGTVKAAPLSTWPAYGAPPATTAAPEPQTLGYVRRRESEITQKIENLKAKKRQLEGFVRTPAP